MKYFDRIVAMTGTDVPGAILPPVNHDMTCAKILNPVVKEENPEQFQQMLHTLHTTACISKPSDTHKVLAEYKIPIITTCADGLHQKAGSDDKKVIELCGNVLKDNLRLYGEPFKNYIKAWDLINMASNNSMQCMLLIGLRGVELKETGELIQSAVDKGYYIKQWENPEEHDVRGFLNQMDNEKDKIS